MFGAEEFADAQHEFNDATADAAEPVPKKM